MKNYYQKEIETASREEILKIQNAKIVKQVKYVYDNVPYYRDLSMNNNFFFFFSFSFTDRRSKVDLLCERE